MYSNLTTNDNVNLSKSEQDKAVSVSVCLSLTSDSLETSDVIDTINCEMV